MIRDKNTQRSDFIFYSDRIIRLLVEEGLNHLPVVEHSVETPTGMSYKGVAFQGRICGVSILRAGEAMEAGLRECCRSVRIGKILTRAPPSPSYVDHALTPATGGSAIQAMQVLVDHGVQPSKILFLNMIASPEGLQNIWQAFPDVRVISAWVDACLSDQQYSTWILLTPVLPGLGDYGDRYYSG
ncbi:unnamed protein product [Malassezia sympodialis ATCC 42132]|uniref:uncharacterized protein n=1 Tax=Malassezia sympodialis (strain ATCC 42132) TaxID=1230383 RepID=UPI0002C1F767|nr:uncharacterized protein MSY001_1469 [Malassezia sympodialis ATCC 42132]CCU98763.1 unnamed protein product [Malassezia sympodialis ATCC 42132]|eukprot:XP_018740048.1 uncharacterized protein MSY001_1469 [Malassezia sympodialis ATCC 42132]